MSLTQDFYKHEEFPIGKRHVIMTKTNRPEFNRWVYKNYIKPRIEISESRNQKVILSDDDVQRIKEFTIKKIKAKELEWRGVDDENRVIRESTGAFGEYATLKYFGLEDKFDDSIVTNSKEKCFPDLISIGICCDVKGSSDGNVPLIFKQQRCYSYKGNKYKCPNLFTTTSGFNVWLLGIATVNVMTTDCDDNLIKTADAPTKTGFYGFDKLIEVPESTTKLHELCWSNVEKIS